MHHGLGLQGLEPVPITELHKWFNATGKYNFDWDNPDTLISWALMKGG